MEPGISRRVFLAQAAGLTLTLGIGGVLRARAGLQRNPYSGGVWLAGDHHIHSKYSPDGQYEIESQVANAEKYGLDWCVITDHGGPHHDRIALSQAYPELVAARKRHPRVLVYQGMEWNVPAAEHASVILPMTADEGQRVSDFEAIYDEKNVSRHADGSRSPHEEADAAAALKYLESLSPKPLFFANHPARQGLDSPHEMRAWQDAGPSVARGFEGAPGHAAFTLVGKPRGEYGKSPRADSFKGYPEESYRTWGGYDYYVAKVGGLWDSLLSEGRPWYITSNSDSHRHWDDREEIDTSTYLTKGYVTPTGHNADHGTDFDFYPGEYAKTWVYAEDRGPKAVLDALRAGSMFTVLGGLVDRLELSASDRSGVARMGSSLTMNEKGGDVSVEVRLHNPVRPNFGGRRAELHHVDLITGDILGPATDRDAMTNPTTKTLLTFTPKECTREGDMLVFRYRFSNVTKGFYIRLRGTNTSVSAPAIDAINVDPWEDLWFYSNPVFVRVPV